MTTAVTKQTLRRAMFDGRIPGLGFAGVADSVTASTLTDAYALRDSNLSASQFKGMYIYRPDTTGENKVRVAGALTPATGALVHTGQDWTETTDLDYEIIGLMHPDELNACITRAMKRVYRSVELVLSGAIVDGDMEASGVGDWTTVGTLASSAKDTSEAGVWSGTQSLHNVNSAVNSGKKCATFDVFPSRAYYCSTVVKCSSGTAKLLVYDETNGAELASVEVSAPGWTHLWLKSTIPLAASGGTQCTQVSVHLLGEEDDADLYWDHAVFYFPHHYEHYAPSWLDEQFKFVGLREAQYKQSVATVSQTYGSYDDAYSRTWLDWQQPGHYSLDPVHSDVHPYVVKLKKAPPMNELWISAKRPWSDTTPLTEEDDTTEAPRDQVEAYIKLEIARVLTKRYPNARQWVMLMQEANEETMAENQARPEISQRHVPRQQPNRGRI